MTMATYLYPSAKEDIGKGLIDLENDTFHLMLVTDSYTPDAAHNRRDDVTNEVTGTGYTAGGAVIPNTAVSLSGTAMKFDGDDVSWGGSTITARGGVVYQSNGGAASGDRLVCAIRFTPNADIASSSGTFIFQFGAGGICTLT